MTYTCRSAQQYQHNKQHSPLPRYLPSIGLLTKYIEPSVTENTADDGELEFTWHIGFTLLLNQQSYYAFLFFSENNSKYHLGAGHKNKMAPMVPFYFCGPRFDVLNSLARCEV